MYFKNMNFLYAIANCGIMTKNIACKHYNIHHKTLNDLVKNNIISVKGNLFLFGKVSTIYVLSENIKNEIRKSSKLPYKTSISQLEHDYLLLKFYSSLPVAAQYTWLNETELKEIYLNTYSIDGLFIMNKLKFGVEVLTTNYTKKMIENKIEFGNKYCDKLITLNTSDIKIKERI